MVRAQSTIIGFILITAMAVILVSLTLFWARPLIDRTQDQQEVLRLEQKMLELHDAIKTVASAQGSLSIPFDINRGFLSLIATNNTINYQGQFDIQYPVSTKLVFGNNTIPTNTTILSAAEIVPLGVEEPAYMYKQGAIEFNLHYRIVNNSGACHRIKLAPGDQSTAGIGRHVIKLTWLNETLVGSPPTNCSNLTDQVVKFEVR